MSQLASGFQEMISQNNRVSQERSKALVLQDLGQTSQVSHHEMKVSSGGKTTSEVGSFRSIASLLNQSMTRPSFLPEQDRGLLTPLFRENFEEEQQQKAAHLRQILDEEDLDFDDTVRMVTHPLIQRQDQMERHYEDQLALQSYELAQQRERHNQNLHRVKDSAKSMLADIYSQSLIRMLEVPQYMESGSASSSSAAIPMRMAIQDLTPVEPATDSDEEELIPAEPVVLPGKLQPKEKDVSHLYKPKAERAKKLQAYGEKIYHDMETDWQREHINVLKEQLRLRPEIKLKKSEIELISKDRAVAFLMNYDKKHSKNYI
jgi:hypothetical protein